MDTETPPAIWEYVPAGEYKLPAASIGSTFKGGLAGLWQRLKPAAPQEPKDPLWSEDDLDRLPDHLLAGAAPPFENLITLFGAVGLALGFAFKDYTSSLIAGIVTLYEMPYRLGDWISVEGAYGEVKAIGMRAVEIVTADDTVVVIPHLKLWDKLIFNANDNSRNLQCAADFYLHPRLDAARVRRTLHDVGLTSPYLQVQKPVAVIVHEKPWGTHYRLKAYPVDPRDQFRFVTDLTVRGKAALAELGMEFAVAPAAVAA